MVERWNKSPQIFWLRNLLFNFPYRQAGPCLNRARAGVVVAGLVDLHDDQSRACMLINTIDITDAINKASERTAGYITQTPVLTSSTINHLAGCNIFFKCENFQKTGSFKFRGATNAVASLEADKLEAGVATHSSGNHAAALALAAAIFGTDAYVVMPHTASRIKRQAAESYGAVITSCEASYQSRRDTLDELIANSGAHFIPPFDDFRIITGQATAALELIREIKGLDYLITPVGGGGLLSGTALAALCFSDHIKVIGVEPEMADDAFRSVRDNILYPSINPQTICDGLLTSLGELTFQVIRDHVSEIITVSETSIIKAMRIIMQRMKIIVEPSSATVLAGILDNKDKFHNKNVGVILSGGNIDLDKLPWVT